MHFCLYLFWPRIHEKKNLKIYLGILSRDKSDKNGIFDVCFVFDQNILSESIF